MDTYLKKAEHAELPIEQDPRWAAVISRDPSADGTFYYSVETTGVYCRPSCAARRANPKNMRFHDNRADAEAAGFRACKRCKPNQPSLSSQQAAKIADACRLIESADEAQSLAVLAQNVGLSAYHFHRIFKTVTGLTPREYTAAHRTKRIHHELAESHTITEAVYGAGFGSNSRFYEKSDAILGMTPTDYRNGGANTEIRFAIGECSLGSILVARSEKGVCAILIGDERDALLIDLRDRFPKANLIGGDASFEQMVAKVVDLVEMPGLGLDLPLDVRGTAFQRRVWQALQQIPRGSTASYAEIAEKIGAPKAVRAVAGACAANALAVVIPCHRVVKSDGTLSGYRWGVERKRKLLDREAGR